MPVLPHAQRDHIQRRHRRDDVRVEARALVGAELGGHAVDRGRRDSIEQGFARHPVVAVRVVRANASFVAKQNGHASPLDVHLGQQLVAPARRRAARQDKTASAITQRLGNVGGRRRSDILGRL